MEHSISMYATIERYKEGVMCDEELTDMQKLQMVFSASKGSLKGNDPQLYYAILGVLDHEKRGATQMHFRRNDHGFLLREDWNTIVSACKVIGDAIWDAPIVE